jgi:hypothetical protein
MNEKEGVNGKEFFVKAAVVAAASVLVLFFAKLWIIDPLVKPAVVAEKPAQEAGFPEKSWAKAKTKIDWKDAAVHLGGYVETEGIIVSSYNSGKVCYLNFDKNYKETLALIIFASNFNRFPEKPEKYYLGKKVRVEGRIKDYKGRLEIVLGSKEQIKIVE